MATAQIQLDAQSLLCVRANRPMPEHLSGTNAEIVALAFDDTTEEFADYSFEVPSDVDTAETVTFRAHVRAKTGAASRNVAMSLYHAAIDNGESWDGAMTEEASGDKAINATTSNVTVIEWTETFANLGWQANDLIIGKLSRKAASANNLTGDMYLLKFVIEMPLT